MRNPNARSSTQANLVQNLQINRDYLDKNVINFSGNYKRCIRQFTDGVNKVTEPQELKTR
jgi:hypothetical protein